MMTWNLRRGDALDWAARRGRVAATLAARRPDILCVQEATAHMLADLAQMLPGHRMIAGVAADGDERNAILVDPAIYDVLDHGGLWLSETPRKPRSRSWGNPSPRVATWARLRERATGAAMLLVNTHLDDASAPARRAMARFLDERFPGAVLAGDFNAEPGTEVHDILTASRRDALPARGYETMHDNEHEADARYDWILVPYDVEVRQAGRIAWPPDESPSDHHAIAARVDATRSEDGTP